MFQTIVDEAEVFVGAKLYDDTAYYAIDGCVFSYKAESKKNEFFSTIPMTYLKMNEIKI